MLFTQSLVGDLVSGEDQLTRKAQRILDGECTRCGAPHQRDANKCDECTSEGTQNTRELRARRRANGRCAFCPKRAKKYRCRSCWKKKHRGRRGVGARKRGVEQPAAPLPTKIERRVEADGYERTRVRYTGRSTRGAPSREQLEAEQVRNARFAGRETAKLIEQLEAVFAAEARELPAAQYASVLHDVLSTNNLAARFHEEIEDFLKSRLKRMSPEENRRNRPR